jgi:hypothetical protein
MGRWMRSIAYFLADDRNSAPFLTAFAIFGILFRNFTSTNAENGTT